MYFLVKDDVGIKYVSLKHDEVMILKEWLILWIDFNMYIKHKPVSIINVFYLHVINVKYVY
jgi:hypothetical protein